MTMKLFKPTTLGKISLSNRVVMAPMTRCRAVGNIPNDYMATYYAQRASAGLIITEGTAPSPNGLGYARIPGCFNEAQVAGWKKVTKAVHEKGGKIFMQLMHTGRASHVENMLPGAKVLAPSAIALSGTIWTDSKQMQSYPIPKEMTLAEINLTISEFAHSAQLAIQAGFDGVELHAANGYLLEEFLNPKCNKRDDEYGQNRMRFVLEVAQAVAKKIGGDKTGIRISPYGVFNDTGEFPGIDEFYIEFAKHLSDLGLVYIHVVDHSDQGAPPVSADLKGKIRETFKGSYILSGGYNAEKAEHDLLENKGDLVAFGRPFIGNPDLVAKLKNKVPLTTANKEKFYTPGPEGYSDYV
jgi:N-ethylmaleimide reductase